MPASAFVEDVVHALIILSELGISTNVDGMRLLSAATNDTFSGTGSGIATPGT